MECRGDRHKQQKSPEFFISEKPECETHDRHRQRLSDEVEIKVEQVHVQIEKHREKRSVRIPPDQIKGTDKRQYRTYHYEYRRPRAEHADQFIEQDIAYFPILVRKLRKVRTRHVEKAGGVHGIIQPYAVTETRDHHALSEAQQNEYRSFQKRFFAGTEKQCPYTHSINVY